MQQEAKTARKILGKTYPLSKIGRGEVLLARSPNGELLGWRKKSLLGKGHQPFLCHNERSPAARLFLKSGGDGGGSWLFPLLAGGSSGNGGYHDEESECMSKEGGAGAEKEGNTKAELRRAQEGR